MQKERYTSQEGIIKNVKRQYPEYNLCGCIFHSNRTCLTLLNAFDRERFHCLYTIDANGWRSYSVTKSCDLPDYVYDLILLNQLLGDEYVLPFASQFRESSGYTICMFRQNIELYPPNIIERSAFKEMAFATIVLYVAVCERLGGVTPDIRFFSFLYTPDHPVLCNIGRFNTQKRERIDDVDRFSRKRWVKLLRRKTCEKIIRYLKLYFPTFFQKKKKGKRCILNEEEGHPFDDVTHKLFCHSYFLIEVLDVFRDLMPDPHIRDDLIPRWITAAGED